MLRFGSNLILTRLLFPELFGLMALVNVFIMGLQLFSDIGVGPSIIQNKRGDDPVFLNTAWTIQSLRSFGIWLCCLAIAYPLSEFYNEPRLIWLIPAVGLGSFISGFNATALFTLNRHIAVKQLAVFEMGSQLIALTVMVTWAWLVPSIWALVGGNLILSVVRMVWSHQLLPGAKNHFAWDRAAVQELFSFGRWIFLSTAMTFLASQADRLILGKLFSLELLGVYTIAFTLSDMPSQLITNVSSKVIFPTISKLVELPRAELRQKILEQRKRILFVLAAFVATLVCIGDFLVLMLYDQRYQEAAWMFPLLIFGIWPRILTLTISPSLFAVGKPRYAAYGNFLKCAFITIGIPVAYATMGIFGAVLIVALNDLPLYSAIAYGLWQEGLSSIKQDLQATTLLIGSLALFFTLRMVLGFGTPI
jgi:O-antigen/teichoic acid export membrane protein